MNIHTIQSVLKPLATLSQELGAKIVNRLATKTLKLKPEIIEGHDGFMEATILNDSHSVLQRYLSKNFSTAIYDLNSNDRGTTFVANPEIMKSVNRAGLRYVDSYAAGMIKERVKDAGTLTSGLVIGSLVTVSVITAIHISSHPSSDNKKKR